MPNAPVPVSPIVPEVSLLTLIVKTVLGWVGIRDAEQKMRENAANWLELAEKVYHFRRDVLPAAQVNDLQARSAELNVLVKERAGAEKLKLGIERLEEALRRTGGAIYPKSALVENVEFFLVAAIVILGIRTYFVQPFKIPTNSMWPTYNGMTAEVWKNPAEAPGTLSKVVRFAMFGARRKEIVAPESGPVSVPFDPDSGRIVFKEKPARSWFIFPSSDREYTFLINDAPVKIQVPLDFDFDTWAFQRFTGLNRTALGQLAQQSTRTMEGYKLVTLEQRAEKGKPFLSFDILTGDQLFVDRMSYHFARPKVGQGFVFRTDHIESYYMRDQRTGGQIAQYYIKRLVGTPGDVLEIRDPALYRNGAPITGSGAFLANEKRANGYAGYFNNGFLSAGKSLTIPPKSFFAMGDNSGNSQDSRYWGYVPAKDVVGRPLFVYFPFTRHWGPAR
ncbi:MAG: signal peptidase I [Opitutaceae bacterium]